MDNENNKTLTAEQEMQLRKPIEDYVGEIQEKIDSLRVDGSNRVVSLQSEIDAIKRDHGLTKEEKTAQTEEIKSEMLKAKAVEAKNKEEISKLIADAEGYLKAHFNKDYYQAVKESCSQEYVAAQKKYADNIAKLEQEHKKTLAKLTDHKEIKNEKYVYKNLRFDAKNGAGKRACADQGQKACGNCLEISSDRYAANV